MKHKSLARVVFFHFLVVAVLPIACIAAIWIFDEFIGFERETAELRAAYLEKQRAILKAEVNNAIKFIEFKRSQTETRLKADIKARVYEAYRIADNFYQEYHQQKNAAELKKMIKDALRPIRFNQGRGYYFIVTLDGVEELYPIAPQFEGRNLLNLQDVQGNYVIQDEIDIVRREREGFVMGFWKKPGAAGKMIYPKITFVKHFPHLNWYIGSGEYLDEVEKDIQQEALEQLAGIRFGVDGYIFVNTYDGKALIMDGEALQLPKDVWELTDPNGVKVIQAEREAVKNPDGDFILYSWRRLSQGIPIPKMSFIKGVAAWCWMIGAGVYLDDLEAEIHEKRRVLDREIYHDILTIIAILLSMLLIVYVNARYFAARTQRHFTKFNSFFQRAASETLRIETQDLSFSEFRALAGAANRMVEQQKQTENALMVEKAYFEGLFENSPESVAILDGAGRVLRVNAEFCRLFGYSKEEVLGEPLDSFIATDAMRSEALQLTQAAWRGERVFVETVRKRKDGSSVDVSVLGVPIRGTKQRVIYAIYRDITERKCAEKELLRLAMTDPLTHVYNRLQFSRSVEEEILLSQRYNHTFSLIMFDIDHFKQVNDMYGHPVGDAVLIDVVTLVRQIIRQSDAFGRWGGDEFMILVKQASRRQAQYLAERIREAIASRMFQDVPALTCSFGVTQFSADDSVETLILRADQALYQAKAQGRNLLMCK